jgi:hypothetical protein
VVVAGGGTAAETAASEALLVGIQGATAPTLAKTFGGGPPLASDVVVSLWPKEG